MSLLLINTHLFSILRLSICSTFCVTVSTSSLTCHLFPVGALFVAGGIPTKGIKSWNVRPQAQFSPICSCTKCYIPHPPPHPGELSGDSPGIFRGVGVNRRRKEGRRLWVQIALTQGKKAAANVRALPQQPPSVCPAMGLPGC